MSSLRMTLCATRRHAALQRSRERRTRYGLARPNRNVLDEFPDNVVGETAPEADLIEREERARRLGIVKGLIRECTKKPEYAELLERCLLHGEPLNDLAAELGMPYSTARSAVSRARRWLGIAKNTKSE